MKLTTENLNTTTKWRAPYIVHYIRDRERFRTQLWSHAECVRLESPVTDTLSLMLTVAIQQKRCRRRRGPDVDSNGCRTAAPYDECIKYANLIGPDLKVLPDTVAGEVTQFTIHMLISIAGAYACVLVCVFVCVCYLGATVPRAADGVQRGDMPD
jgi:hypothetical protein